MFVLDSGIFEGNEGSFGFRGVLASSGCIVTSSVLSLVMMNSPVGDDEIPVDDDGSLFEVLRVS
jgi:hypothetical protein